MQLDSEISILEPTLAADNRSALTYICLGRFSNFDGKGPAAVGSHQGLGPYGTCDMAGNVKEWTWNEAGTKRYILGGAME